MSKSLYLINRGFYKKHWPLFCFALVHQRHQISIFLLLSITSLTVKHAASVCKPGVKRQAWYSFKRWQVVFFGPIRHRGARGQHSCREANPPQSFSALRAGVTLPALNTSSWTCSCRSDKNSPGLLQNELSLAGNKLSLYFLTTIKYFSTFSSHSPAGLYPRDKFSLTYPCLVHTREQLICIYLLPEQAKIMFHFHNLFVCSYVIQ